jgi:hypothetical protein
MRRGIAEFEVKGAFLEVNATPDITKIKVGWLVGGRYIPSFQGK